MKLALIVLLLMHFCSFAQNQNNQWRFGFGSAIDFNTTPPSYPTGCALPTVQAPFIAGDFIEGTASIADRNTGNLLFYTDGITVWNSLNQPMPNGSNLGGNDALSSYMAAVIIPFPDSCSKYYIFCQDDFEEGSDGITYSVVDMSLDNGLGDILPGQKSIPLYDNNLTEMLMAYPKSSGDGYWLISNGPDAVNPTFAAFEVTSLGVNPLPVLSPVLLNASGKLNYQGTKFVCTGEYDPAIGNFLGFQLYDFNAATGQISNPVNIPFQTSGDVLQYFEFTFDGNYLYAGGPYSLYHFDLSSGNPNLIAASGTELFIGNSSNPHFGPQMGPDSNLYYVVANTTSGLGPNTLYKIENPSNPASLIGPISALPANVTPSIGLPQWIAFSNLFNCTDTTTPPPAFEFPNVFTPNNDGINDLFKIDNLPQNTEVVILNRWGNVVYSSENYQNNWDGKDNSGTVLVEGVYTYKFTTESGKIGHGFLHLIR